MKFNDLKAQYDVISDRIERNIGNVLTHCEYIMGPEVSELEARLANYTAVSDCIGVSSGTDALLIALMALGVQAGDEVITTPFTFIATVETILLLGARPVFVDIDPQTYNIDCRFIENAITPRTKAIIAVDLFGQCADYDEINATANKHNLPVIEDAAQSFGATYKGRKAGSLTTIGCTSFFPSKPLGCYGDGGAVFTSDKMLADRMREIRVHGQRKRYFHHCLGINGRLDTVQAAILLAKLEIFEQELQERIKIAHYYNDLLKDINVVTPYVRECNQSVYGQYTVLVENRDHVAEMLKAIDIPTAIHYPMPAYKQPIVEKNTLHLEHSEFISARVLSLPMHPYLSCPDQEKVSNGLREIAGTT